MTETRKQELDKLCKKYSLNLPAVKNTAELRDVAEKQGLSAVLGESVSALELDERHTAALMLENIHTVKDLLSLTYQGFQDFTAAAGKQFDTYMLLKQADSAGFEDWVKAVQNEDSSILVLPVSSAACKQSFHLKETPIDDLDLDSVRLYNVLKRAGFYCLEDIMLLSQTQVGLIRNIGTKATALMLEILASHGLESATDAEYEILEPFIQYKLRLNKANRIVNETLEYRGIFNDLISD